ncbi:MAG: hypothetical protein OEZ58_06650 [Gammaproteobacteria bacterium]|nr:hypothetical protein [Gammaproteobacteria bacterium]
MASCVILKTTKIYGKEYYPKLMELYSDDLDLFSVVGTDCESWEDAMDWLCIDLDTEGKVPGAFCNTTSHPNENFEEVLEFAKVWCKSRKLKEDIKIVEI